jgi:hypothetical protein
VPDFPYGKLGQKPNLAIHPLVAHLSREMGALLRIESSAAL